MASIDKRVGKNGDISWRARVTVNGKTRAATRRRKTDATAWAAKGRTAYREGGGLLGHQFGVGEAELLVRQAAAPASPRQAGAAMARRSVAEVKTLGLESSSFLDSLLRQGCAALFGDLDL